MSTSPEHARDRAPSGDHDRSKGAAPTPEPGQNESSGIDADLRRRLDEVFGDVMPRVTSDERDPGERSGMDVEFYRANRPPHHDR